MTSSAARSYRLGMWLFLGLGLVLLGLAILGARIAAARSMGLLALAGFVVCLGIAAMLALHSRRALVEQREHTARMSTLVIMAGILQRESDETLERIAASSGPAAEAATLLLSRRSGEGRQSRPSGQDQML